MASMAIRVNSGVCRTIGSVAAVRAITASDILYKLLQCLSQCDEVADPFLYIQVHLSIDLGNGAKSSTIFEIIPVCPETQIYY
jgi:hypothetical protein